MERSIQVKTRLLVALIQIDGLGPLIRPFDLICARRQILLGTLRVILRRHVLVNDQT